MKNVQVIGILGALVALAAVWWNVSGGDEEPAAPAEQAASESPAPATPSAVAPPPIAPAPPAEDSKEAGLSGVWKHADTVISLACEGSPRQEKQVQGETFELKSGGAGGQLQYADDDCSFTLEAGADSARIATQQPCTGRGPELIYEQLEVTRESPNSIRLAGHGTMTVQQKTGPLKCSFDAKGVAVRESGT